MLDPSKIRDVQQISESSGRLLAELAAWKELTPDTISGDLPAIEQYLKSELNKSPDAIVRVVECGSQQRVLMVYIDGLVDTEMVDQDIIAPHKVDGS